MTKLREKMAFWGNVSQIGQGAALASAGLAVAIGYVRKFPWPVTLAIALILFGVVSAIFAWRRHRTAVSASAPRAVPSDNSLVTSIRPVIGQTFMNATVVLDGVRYSKCTFRNCTIQWLGGSWGGWDDRCVFENVRYQTVVPGAIQAIDQLKGLGFLGDEFAKSWGLEEVRIVGLVVNPGDRPT